MKSIGIVIVTLSVLAIIPSMISALGVLIAYVVLVIGGFTALSGKLKYAIIVLVITTINISFFSVATEMFSNKQKITTIPPKITHKDSKTELTKDLQPDDAAHRFILFSSVPYGVTLVLILVGVLRKSRLENEVKNT